MHGFSALGSEGRKVRSSRISQATRDSVSNNQVGRDGPESMYGPQLGGRPLGVRLDDS